MAAGSCICKYSSLYTMHNMPLWQIEAPKKHMMASEHISLLIGSCSSILLWFISISFPCVALIITMIELLINNKMISFTRSADRPQHTLRLGWWSVGRPTCLDTHPLSLPWQAINNQDWSTNYSTNTNYSIRHFHVRSWNTEWLVYLHFGLSYLFQLLRKIAKDLEPF